MMTFAQVDALTNSELQELLEDLDMNPQEVRGMVHAKKVSTYWSYLKSMNAADAPKEEDVMIERAVAKEAVRKPAKAKEGKECACGCGNTTKGGTWMPGHDAVYASRMKGNTPGGSKAPKPCRCGCGGMTKGGIYCPGHDSKHLSALLKAFRAKEMDSQVGSRLEALVA